MCDNINHIINKSRIKQRENNQRQRIFLMYLSSATVVHETLVCIGTCLDIRYPSRVATPQILEKWFAVLGTSAAGAVKDLNLYQEQVGKIEQAEMVSHIPIAH